LFIATIRATFPVNFIIFILSVKIMSSFTVKNYNTPYYIFISRLLANTSR